jgi:rhodanese-related sulfurtransferase
MKKITMISLALLVLFLTGCSGQEQDNDAMIEKEVQMEDGAGMNDQMVPEEMENSVMENEEGMVDEEMMEEDAEMMEEDVRYMDISVQEAKIMVDEDPAMIVIDVSPKYAEGHVPDAVNYYVGDGSLDKAIPTLDKNAKYLVYCHVDSASILGAQKLIDAGFENVYRMEGNYSAWVAAGFPVEK